MLNVTQLGATPIIPSLIDAHNDSLANNIQRLKTAIFRVSKMADAAVGPEPTPAQSHSDGPKLPSYTVNLDQELSATIESLLRTIARLDNQG